MRALNLVLVTPMEAIIPMEWAEVSQPLPRHGNGNEGLSFQPTLQVVIRTALGSELFEKIDEDGGSPKSYTKLAEMTS